jgi:hypothetical protein
MPPTGEQRSVAMDELACQLTSTTTELVKQRYENSLPCKMARNLMERIKSFNENKNAQTLKRSNWKSYKLSYKWHKFTF